MNFPSVKLSSGYMMPVLGLGTFRCPPEDAYNATKEAIKIGYRHIDTAQAYCNESGVGKAINECIQEGIIKREEIFVTTKIWCIYNTPEDVLKGCEKSLKNLNLDYIDLMLIHNPFPWSFDEEARSKLSEEDQHDIGCLFGLSMKVQKYDPKVVATTWAGMEEAVAKGIIRSIGISNFTAKKTEDLLKVAKIMPVTNQPTVIKYCESKGITITAFSQFRNLSDIDPSETTVFKNPTIAAIGKKYNKNNSQVILRWLIQRKIFAIPKSVHSDRLRENLNVFDFELSEEDMKTMNEMNKNKRGSSGILFAAPGVSVEDVWDHEDC